MLEMSVVKVENTKVRPPKPRTKGNTSVQTFNAMEELLISLEGVGTESLNKTFTSFEFIGVTPDGRKHTIKQPEVAGMSFNIVIKDLRDA